MYKTINFLFLLLFLCACTGNHRFRTKTNSTYTIQPGDIIRVELLNYPQFNENLLVDFSGSIKPSEIGGVVVKGCSQNDLQILLTSAYSNLVTEPNVLVEILAPTKRAIYVAGKINKPGIIRYEGKLTVEKSIGLAGGIKNIIGNYYAYVLRKKSDGSWTKFKIDIKANNTNSGKNNSAFKLAPYDIVYVTQSTEKDAGDLAYDNGFGTEI